MTEEKPSHSRRNLFITLGIIVGGLCLSCGLLLILSPLSEQVQEKNEAVEETPNELEIELTPILTSTTTLIEKTVVVIYTQIVTATELEATPTITTTPTVASTYTISPTSTQTTTPSRTPTVTRTPTPTWTYSPEPTEDPLTADHWDGIFGVGIDIAPGRWQVNDPYVIPLSGQPDCYWARYNSIFNIIEDGYGQEPPFVIVVAPSDSWVELDHCRRVIYLGP